MTLGDESEVMALWWHPQKGQVVFDVGCSSGIWSMPAMRAGAFVYAFDPDPVGCRGFFDNARNSGFSPAQFTVENVAIGAVNEDAWSIRDAWGAMGVPLSVMAEYLNRLDYGGRMVKLRTLDFFANRITRLDWIKIDVEGFEYDVIRGAKNILRKYKPKLIVENHSKIDHIGAYASSRWPGLISMLLELGYKTTEKPYGASGHLYAE